MAVLGVGAAGGAWRRAVEARGAGGSIRPQALSRAFALDECATPVSGSQCARDIDYAMTHISKHPDWYVNLDADDNPKAFQMFLFKQRVKGGGRRCPMPCDWSERKQHHDTTHVGECHTSSPGEECFNHVQYTIKENLPNHPEWYPGLAQGSSPTVVQQYLHHQDAGVCPKPCHLEKELQKAKRKKEKEEKEKAEKAETVDGKPCHTAEAGEACYNDVLFARKKLREGLHNDWYDGKLDQYSSLEEIQAYLHRQHSNDKDHLCTPPCNKEAIENITRRGSEKCHTAREGDDCWKAAEWVVKTGIKTKPQWYKGDNISSLSTFEHVQNRLSREKNEDRACRAPACPCRTAMKGDDCWNAVKWVQDVGLKNHSDWYTDILPDPTFEQIQTRLHNDQHTKCPLPCIFAPWWEKPKLRLLADEEKDEPIVA